MSSGRKKIDKVANYFIYKSLKENRPDLTNKKLQKLLYYAQAWSLALQNKKLFDDEFEAWIHGPANPYIYRRFKKYGWNPISEDVTTSPINLSETEMQLLDEVWRVYGKYDGEYLELLTHNELPWIQARADKAAHESSKAIISTELMKRYYGEKQKAAQG